MPTAITLQYRVVSSDLDGSQYMGNTAYFDGAELVSSKT